MKKNKSQQIKDQNFYLGWIKLSRGIKDHWLWPKNRPLSYYEAWCLMIIEANFEDSKVLIGNQLFDCLRGEKLYSLSTWAKKFNWHKSKVKRFFNLLEKDSMIVLKNEHKTTRLTICKYEFYQGKRNDDETQAKRKRNNDETQAKPIKESKKKRTKEGVCNATTPIFSINDIEKLFIERETALEKKANPGAANKFRLHYQREKWTYKGKPIVDLVPHIDYWIETEKPIPKKPPGGSMVYKLPTNYLQPLSCSPAEKEIEKAADIKSNN